MADKSAIEWTDATWNPIRARNLKTGKVGWHCEHLTTGCEFCYAEGFNKRLGTGLDFKPGHRKDVELFLDEAMLTQPLRWKKPRTIFVCSMTDLFADFVPAGWIERMFAVMDLTPQHTYQVLTKRALRMRRVVGDPSLPTRLLLEQGRWPLPNVWLGVSAERQQEADERIPLLLQTPAAVRFISAEPLLGPIDLTNHEPHGTAHGWSSIWKDNAIGRPWLDWVIAGGESGPKARPMHPDWARSLRDQCKAADVAFFFKQWGEWAPSSPEQAAGNPRSGWRTKQAHPHVAKAEELYPGAGAAFIARVGKKAAGRHLDGQLHNALPACPPELERRRERTR